MDGDCTSDVMMQSQDIFLIKSIESINDVQNNITAKMISESLTVSEFQFTPNYPQITGRVIDKEVAA